MINLLTEVAESTSTFDMDMLWMVLLIFIPILLAIIASKTWNIVHGIITYLLFSFLVVYLLDLELLTKVFSDETIAVFYSTYLAVAHFPVSYIWLQLSEVEFLNSMLSGDAANHIMLALYAVLFILSQIIGSMLRKNR